MSDATEDAELVQALELSMIDGYCIIASLALLFYDQLLTMSKEVELMWSRKFNGGSILFLLLRYITLISKILLVIVTFWWPNQNDKVAKCAAPVLLEEITVMLVYIVVAIFSAGRIYAIWGKGWRPASIVLSVALLIPITNLYHYARSTPGAWPAPFVGCGENMALSDAQFASISYGFIMLMILMLNRLVSFVTHSAAIATDALVIILTWAKTIGVKRLARQFHIKTTITTLLLRDGTLYFSVLLMLHVVYFATWRANLIFNPMPLFIDVFTTILITRFMLKLRLVFISSGNDTGRNGSTFIASGLSHVDFAPMDSVLGNLGAPLSHGAWTAASSECDPAGDIEEGVCPASSSIEDTDHESTTYYVAKDPLAVDIYLMQENAGEADIEQQPAGPV